LLENKTQEEIARELHIFTCSVFRYCQRIEKRYGAAQRQKIDDSLLMEVQLFKNRMLTLYKGLEDVVISKDRNISGIEKAKAAEVATNIAIDVIKTDSEVIYAVKQGLVNISTAESVVANKNKNNNSSLNKLRNGNNDYAYDDDEPVDNNSRHTNQIEEDYNDRKF
jgi:hypothetical protein